MQKLVEYVLQTNVVKGLTSEYTKFYLTVARCIEQQKRDNFISKILLYFNIVFCDVAAGSKMIVRQILEAMLEGIFAQKCFICFNWYLYTYSVEQPCM